MGEAVIVSAVRTPIGSFGGALKGFSAVELGNIVAGEALKRGNVPADAVDEVILGHVLQAGLGQNTARQVAVNIGLPVHVPALTINKVCGSGLKAVALAAQAIKAEDAQVVLAGGMESMSNAPYLLPAARWGARMGDGAIIDTILTDGLMDAFNHIHMGMTAENIAAEQQISREAQDAFACESQRRAEAAIKAGRFKDEIIPLTIPQRKGEPVVCDTDEFPRFGTTVEKLAALKPAFKKDGTVTAGNASGINDGAAAFVVMSKEKALSLGVKPLATVVSYASHGVEPSTMGYGPIFAVQTALKKAGMTIGDIDLFESNEAFAAQALSVIKALNLDTDKVNVNGGAIALGHPIGASGARILVSLLHEMGRRDAKTGLATLCIGGGQGIALIVKREA